MNKLLIGVMATMLAQAAWAGDWIFLGSNDEFLYWGDRGSRETNRAWFKYRFLKPRKNSAGKTHIETRALSEMNCAERQSRILSGVFYNQSGQSVSSFTLPPYMVEWENVIPDSIGETEYRFVCEHDPL